MTLSVNVSDLALFACIVILPSGGRVCLILARALELFCEFWFTCGSMEDDFSPSMEDRTMEESQATNEGMTIELENDREKSVAVAKSALIEKLITDKPQNQKTMKGKILKSWGFPKGLHIIDLQMSTYLFNFSEAFSPRRIMEEALWHILGYLLNLQRWIPEVSIHEVDYNFCPF